ncbi:MAG: cyclic nucleotide-binding domain-containing protein [Nitrospinaceae bacterium]
MSDKGKYLELMHDIDFFHEFSDSQKDTLAEEKTCFLKYRSGESIITKGERDDTLYVILEGNAVVTKGFKEVTLATLGNGDLFGEMSLMLRKPRTTNIVTTTNVTVWKLNGEILDTLDWGIQKVLRKKIVEFLAQRLDDMNDKYLALIKKRKEQAASGL